jgi:hypothetical protein
MGACEIFCFLVFLFSLDSHYFGELLTIDLRIIDKKKKKNSPFPPDVFSFGIVVLFYSKIKHKKILCWPVSHLETKQTNFQMVFSCVFTHGSGFNQRSK